jgi:hypothetical protein
MCYGTVSHGNGLSTDCRNLVDEASMLNLAGHSTDLYSNDSGFLRSFDDLGDHQNNLISDNSIPSKPPGLGSLCMLPLFEDVDSIESISSLIKASLLLDSAQLIYGLRSMFWMVIGSMS